MLGPSFGFYTLLKEEKEPQVNKVLDDLIPSWLPMKKTCEIHSGFSHFVVWLADPQHDGIHNTLAG